MQLQIGALSWFLWTANEALPLILYRLTCNTRSPLAWLLWDTQPVSTNRLCRAKTAILWGDFFCDTWSWIFSEQQWAIAIRVTTNNTVRSPHHYTTSNRPTDQATNHKCDWGRRRARSASRRPSVCIAVPALTASLTPKTVTRITLTLTISGYQNSWWLAGFISSSARVEFHLAVWMETWGNVLDQNVTSSSEVTTANLCITCSEISGLCCGLCWLRVPQQGLQ